MGASATETGGVEDGEDAVPRRDRPLDGVVDLGQVVNRPEEVPPIAPVGDQAADRELAMQDQPRPVADGDGIAETRNPADKWEERRAQPNGIQVSPPGSAG